MFQCMTHIKTEYVERLSCIVKFVQSSMEKFHELLRDVIAYFDEWLSFLKMVFRYDQD